MPVNRTQAGSSTPRSAESSWQVFISQLSVVGDPLSSPQSYSMRTRLLILGACVLSCTSAPAPAPTPAPAIIGVTAAPSPPLEYSGVYISTPDEDYFSPCGGEGTGDTWSLRFRDNDPHAVC